MPNLLVTRDHRINTHARIRRLSTTVLVGAHISKVIEALRDDPDLAAWVKNGLDLHRDRHSTTCLFCGNPIGEQRLKAIEEHFSQQYEQFIRQLDEMIASLDTSVDEAEKFHPPERANLYEHLADPYESARCEFIDQVAEYREFLVQTREHLDRKKEKAFEALSCRANPPDVDSTHLDDLNTTIATHNQETDEFDSTVREARSKLEASHVAESIEIYKELTEAIKNLADKIDAERKQAERTQNEIDALEKQIVEHRKSAEELNRDIEAYLGRSEIQLSVDDAEPGYKLMRDGQLQPADSLSEGERTAIAFLYFLMSLRDKDFKLNEGIVVIDDPVSSLDANAMFAAFAFMKERTESAGQLFVLMCCFSRKWSFPPWWLV